MIYHGRDKIKFLVESEKVYIAETGILRGFKFYLRFKVKFNITNKIVDRIIRQKRKNCPL